ncbi:STAS domain-containing protein [Amycolatopsis magusensis]|uniref:STAS domain-containing protein n=1 Tax=Amycolatopsis magusensis TaxID=882444 RepID=UPI003C2B8691
MSVTGSESAVRTQLARVLRASGDELTESWVTAQLGRLAEGNQPARAELRAEAAAVVGALRGGLESELPVDRIVREHQPLRDAIAELSSRRARDGAAPGDTAMAILSLKEVLLTAVRRKTTEPAVLLETALEVNRLLDTAGLLAFQSYVEGREEIIRVQHEQMLELSTPVVQLWRHILAVPLIGTLDSARTQVVMNGLLESIQANEARVAIIDITGVPTVDTVVAQHLLQTVGAVRLMGAECLISGIRPAIAQTITQLGIDLSMISTRSTLADALAEAMRVIEAEDGASGPEQFAGAR